MPATLNGSKPKMKYLFSAVFEDGAVIDQTPEDVSRLDPKRSLFYDVLQYDEKISRLVSFTLIDDTRPDQTEYGVDLLTGEFAVNGHRFQTTDQNVILTEPLRLVYFRETRMETDMKNNKVFATRHYINRYFIGWQTNLRGKNYQSTIAVW